EIARSDSFLFILKLQSNAGALSLTPRAQTAALVGPLPEGEGNGGVALCATLVEPFVIRVERRNCDVCDFHFADGAMTTTGLDQDRAHRFYGKALAVEFHEGVAFDFED